jgi:hypothetical protein
MKQCLIFVASQFLTHLICGQATDSTSSFITAEQYGTSNKADQVVEEFYGARGHKRWISRRHITIETTKLQLSSVEDEIAELESQECDALYRRDTLVLRVIWWRDFTLDGPKSELRTGNSPIPYYTTLYRTIDSFTVTDGVVYTSGTEYMRRLQSNGKVMGLVTRRFTHMWVRKLFSWKLSSKTYINN